jgi:hypothetical protein
VSNWKKEMSMKKRFIVAQYSPIFDFCFQFELAACSGGWS